MLNFYRFLTEKAEPALENLLEKRLNKGKEDKIRLQERKGVASRHRPHGALIWLHAASVGEAQSALILVNEILKLSNDVHILVTTGTKTSAALMSKKLPERAFHQFYPLDHPNWVERFLSHWHPDLVLWMESEIWPNMLLGIKERGIPAALINAKLSDKSYGFWKLMRGSARTLISTFSIILTQTEKDANRYKKLGAQNVISTDNIKYSAAPLSSDKQDLTDVIAHFRGRPAWLFASTHAGEEEMACRIHQILKNSFEDLLTVIAPRHPQRGEDILALCESKNLETVLRGREKKLPTGDTDIYIANTMGELGLFYRAVPIACIGRSFSNDGGGGHNPIEAAQLNCAVLHGPNVQNLQDIYDQMDKAMASTELKTEEEFTETLHSLLSNSEDLKDKQKRALAFAQEKDEVLERVMKNLRPVLEETKIIKST